MPKRLCNVGLFLFKPHIKIVHDLLDGFYIDNDAIIAGGLSHVDMRQCEIKDIKLYQARTKVIALG